MLVAKVNIYHKIQKKYPHLIDQSQFSQILDQFYLELSKNV